MITNKYLLGKIVCKKIAKGYTQIVSVVSVDVSDVSEVLITGLSCLAIA